MPDKPFVVNDRRKFTAEGEVRPDAPPSEARQSEPPAKPADAAEPRGPQAVPPPTPQGAATEPELSDEAQLPPPPTPEQLTQAARAYEATVERLDIALRAQNLGGERAPQMSFERLVQSLYMQSILQLGGATEPGQPPQLDILGARQTIDMLTIIAAKASGNLSDAEQNLLDAALFEMHMGFLEVTQTLARQASSRQAGPAAPPPGGPTLVT